MAAMSLESQQYPPASMGDEQSQQQVPPIEDDDRNSEWMNNSRSTLLVVVTLITALTFQLGVNPPGGFWQDNDGNHRAGRPTMADEEPWRFLAFSMANWLCFYYSLLLIAWLLSGKSLKSPAFTLCFVFCIAALALLYLVSQPGNMLHWCFITWVLLIGSTFVYYRQISRK